MQFRTPRLLWNVTAIDIKRLVRVLPSACSRWHSYDNEASEMVRTLRAFGADSHIGKNGTLVVAVPFCLYGDNKEQVGRSVDQLRHAHRYSGQVLFVAPNYEGFPDEIIQGCHLVAAVANRRTATTLWAIEELSRQSVFTGLVLRS